MTLKSRPINIPPITRVRAAHLYSSFSTASVELRHGSAAIVAAAVRHACVDIAPTFIDSVKGNLDPYRHRKIKHGFLAVAT